MRLSETFDFRRHQSCKGRWLEKSCDVPTRLIATGDSGCIVISHKVIISVYGYNK